MNTGHTTKQDNLSHKCGLFSRLQSLPFDLRIKGLLPRSLYSDNNIFNPIKAPEGIPKDRLAHLQPACSPPSQLSHPGLISCHLFGKWVIVFNYFHVYLIFMLAAKVLPFKLSGAMVSQIILNKFY